MSARNGDKSRFHRLRKAKIRRRLRTELLQSLVTTSPGQGAATEAPTAETESGERPVRGPLAAVAETVGSTMGTIVAKTTHPHPEPEPADKPAE
jgi:hypothetical protein